MSKENITKFNLENAFKALDEIEIPAVKGIKANKPIRESISNHIKTDCLLEDYYDINDPNDLEDAQSTREDEIAKAKLARIEKIVDLDAESADDLLTSYEGKVVIQCPQCMNMFYKNKEDIVESDDPTTVNVGETCQHCGNESGYTLIGKIAPVTNDEMSNFEGGEEAAEDEGALDLDFEEPTEEGEEDIDLDVSEEGGEGEEDIDLEATEETEEEKKEESFTSGEGQVLTENVGDEPIKESGVAAILAKLRSNLSECNNTVTEEVPGIPAEVEPAAETEVETTVEETPTEETVETEVQEESLNESGIKGTAGELSDLFKLASEKGLNTFEDLEKFVKDKGLVKPDIKTIIAELKKGEETKTESLTEDKISRAQKKVDKLNAKQANLQRKSDEVERKKAQAINKLNDVKAQQGAAVINNDTTTTSTNNKSNVRNTLDKLKANVINNDSNKSTVASQPATQVANTTVSTNNKNNIRNTLNKLKANLNEDLDEAIDNISDADFSNMLKSQAFKEAGKEIAAEEGPVMENVETNDEDELKESSVKSILARLKSQLSEGADCENGICEEGCEDGQCLDECGNTDNLQEASAKSVLAKLKANMNEEVEEDIDIEAEDIDDLASDDLDYEALDEIDDESFEECISESLTNVYENVESFTLTNCATEGTKLVVEGIVNFKSGNSKKMKYTFTEAHKFNNKLYSLRGINESLDADGSFRLLAGIKNNKLISEKLYYVYTKDNTLIEGFSKKKAVKESFNEDFDNEETNTITNVGVDEDKLVDNGDSISGLCTIYSTVDGEEYEDDLAFNYDKKTNTATIIDESQTFAPAEITAAELILADNLKTNFLGECL